MDGLRSRDGQTSAQSIWNSRLPAQSRSPLRVAFYTDPAAWSHPGGGEVQLEKTATYISRLGVDVRVIKDANGELDDCNCLHLFGTSPACLAMARRAVVCGVPIVLSTITWYDPWVNWHLESSAWRKLRGVAGWTIRRTAPKVPSWRRELLEMCELLLPNSKAEAAQLVNLFAVPRTRITVVPNGVDERFACGDPELFVRAYGVEDFVLVAGRIEPRKNQRNVLRALWGSGLPVVVMGEPVPGSASYMEACRREADAGTTFIDRLPHDSPLLASAYAAARVVVLASWFETPGLAALEGAIAGAQIVVTDRGSASEYFDDAAHYVAPNDLWSIRKTVRDAFGRQRQHKLRAVIRQNFLWEHVAQRTLNAYHSLAQQHLTDRQRGGYAAAA